MARRSLALTGAPGRAKGARERSPRTGTAGVDAASTAPATSHPSLERQASAMSPQGQAMPRPFGSSGTAISISVEKRKPRPSGWAPMARNPVQRAEDTSTRRTSRPRLPSPRSSSRSVARIQAFMPSSAPTSCPAPLASTSRRGAADQRIVPPTICDGKSPSTEKSDVAGRSLPGDCSEAKSSKRYAPTRVAAETRPSAMPGDVRS